MLIEILIPTYNRTHWLEKNIHNISNIINELTLNDKVGLIISNNCSQDDTQETINRLKKSYNNISIKSFNQLSNIGLEQNVLFVLEKASSDYIMFLGDDDYFSKEYLFNVIQEIEHDTELACIIPSFKEITTDGNDIPDMGRDVKLPTRHYKKGFSSCLELSWRGHQLSGIVLKRDSLYSEYKRNGVHNLYPFIFFVAISTLRGNSVHLTEFPIAVTRTAQRNKNWGYGKDGLISDIYENYKKINVNLIQRTRLETKMLSEQGWRLTKSGLIKLPRTVINIILNENTSFITKIALPIIILVLLPKFIVRFIIRKIGSKNYES